MFSLGSRGPLFLLICTFCVTLVTSYHHSRYSSRNDGSVHFPKDLLNKYRGNPYSTTSRPRPPLQLRVIQGCNCLPQYKCSKGYGQFKTKCITENGRSGICCIQQRGNQEPAGLRPNENDHHVSVDSWTISRGMAKGDQMIQQLRKDNSQRLANGEFLDRSSSAGKHAFFFQTSKRSVEIHEEAYQMVQSSAEIAKLKQFSSEQSFFGLSKTETPNCPRTKQPNCEKQDKYRTIDGTCNNLRFPNFGKSETSFARIVPPIYDDGIMNARVKGVDNKQLPNVREISTTILSDQNKPDNHFTLNLMQWSQFIDHDLTQTPFTRLDGEGIICCKNGIKMDSRHSSCFTIDILSTDPFYGDKNQKCMNFVRSLFSVKRECRFGPAEQQNSLTDWLDGSMIYGSSKETLDKVADLQTGFMKISNNNLLPLTSSNTFIAGDSRNSVQPALITMHTIWIREHNRIAKILKKFNSKLSPKELFEQTRRIIIAQVQHISYNEWLPIILGKSTMTMFGINTLKSGFRKNYDSNIDPTMYNEFATAAFRYGHSLVQGSFKFPSDSISNTGPTIRLRDVFVDSEVIRSNPRLVEDFVRSLTSQPIQALDRLVTNDLTNHLFEDPRKKFGMDLMSLNIQRGRDHAIGTYTELRRKFDLGDAKSFFDLRGSTSDAIIQKMQSLYSNVDDIDLFVGGITENHLQDALLGPLFARIVGTQFEKLMHGDRFFYDLEGQTGSFTLDQLNEIRKSTMAKIFCDNTDTIDRMQKKAFIIPGSTNPLVNCEEIPGIDLKKFGPKIDDVTDYGREPGYDDGYDTGSDHGYGVYFPPGAYFP